MLPIDQVPADSMPPMHRTPQGIVGVVLVKKVIFTLIVHQPIGVIHPHLGWCEMVLRSEWLIKGHRAAGYSYP